MVLYFDRFAIYNYQIESRAKLKERLKMPSGTKSIILGEDAEQDRSLNLLKIFSDWGLTSQLNIGVINELPNLHFLVVKQPETLILGYNSNVAGVNLESQEMSFNIELDTSFTRFWQADDESILVFHEVGVSKISIIGQVIWQYTGDIITNCRVIDDKMELSFMDSPSVILHLSSGNQYEP